MCKKLSFPFLLEAASFVEYYLIPSAVVGDLVKEEGVNELLAKHIAITHITFKPEFGRFLTSSYDTFKKEQNCTTFIIRIGFICRSALPTISI